MRRTKIVCTIGPASSSTDELDRLVAAGLDVARLNFSHGTHEEHADVIRRIREGEARVTLASAAETKAEAITLPSLDLSTALLPILRVATDLVRTVVSTDRAQSKNLRLSGLRDEVRALRRILR